ncbi:unnamed protein product [Linum trigynum]|uniref:Uncharacterized protein n=1 Tax=Linum trigynum TaxID=586398 RepID=A0AAV2D8C4_9ROSI
MGLKVDKRMGHLVGPSQDKGPKPGPFLIAPRVPCRRLRLRHSHRLVAVTPQLSSIKLLFSSSSKLDTRDQFP